LAYIPVLIPTVNENESVTITLINADSDWCEFLEETNFLFDILRDIAESHGCHNLSEEVKHIRNIQE
jgi:hypothetical protein